LTHQELEAAHLALTRRAQARDDQRRRETLMVLAAGIAAAALGAWWGHRVYTDDRSVPTALMAPHQDRGVTPDGTR
jgi:hypothetical protein